MRTKVVSFFHIFPRAFKQKEIKALQPKMTKIASKGSCLKKPHSCWKKKKGSKTKKRTEVACSKPAVYVLLFFLLQKPLLFRLVNFQHSCWSWSLPSLPNLNWSTPAQRSKRVPQTSLTSKSGCGLCQPVRKNNQHCTRNEINVSSKFKKRLRTNHWSWRVIVQSPESVCRDRWASKEILPFCRFWPRRECQK